MKKQITILCVTYKSDDCCRNYVESVQRAAARVRNKALVDIRVSDNNSDNKGYFGGIKQLVSNGYQPSDFVIISNVDLLMSEDFFERLLATDLDDTIGCIAPSIYSEREHQERNPEYQTRPNKKRLRTAKCMYLHPLIFHLYKRLVYRKRTPKQTPEKSSFIYAPHGSFMIFTNDEWLRQTVFQFEPFLYGEEIFIAEALRKENKKVLFEPKLKIRDLDHVSTSTLPSRFLCRCHREALSFILKYF